MTRVGERRGFTVVGKAFFFGLFFLLFTHYSFASSKLDKKIQKDYEEFSKAYKEFALFSPEDFRTPLHNQFLQRFHTEDPQFQIKVKQAEKVLDEYQKIARSMLLLNAVRASENQFPSIYQLAKTAAKKLELSENFNLFIVGSSESNAFTYSYDPNDYDIVLFSELIETLDEQALLAVIAHEMGHVKDQAALYSLLFAAEYELKEDVEEGASDSSTTSEAFYQRMYPSLPVFLRNGLVRAAKQYAKTYGSGLEYSSYNEIEEFYRQCETTADRAAVIVAGEKPALRALASLAYGSKKLSKEFNVEAFIEQVKQAITENSSPEDLNIILQNRGTHPFQVLRLIEAKDFAGSKTIERLNKRQSQHPLGKELDLYVNISLRLKNTKNLLEQYKLSQAELDDPYVRINKLSLFEKEINNETRGLNTLRGLVLSQLEESSLENPQNDYFDLFVEKVKFDKDNQLRAAVAPEVVTLIEKKLKNSSLSNQDRSELESKLRIVNELIDLIRNVNPDNGPDFGPNAGLEAGSDSGSSDKPQVLGPIPPLG